MGRLRDASNSKVARELVRAAAAGHDVDRLLTVRKGTPGLSAGTCAVCSCGWMSTPRGRKVLAAAAGYWHALEVVQVLEERGRLDGVEWSDAPSSDTLHRQSRHRAVEAGEVAPRRR
jgi:hypothetical protein